jgi:hypothetical protein
MSSTVNCFGSAQVCGIRVARLNSACQSVAGVSNAVATSAIVKIASTPEYAQGEEFFLKNGCGQVCISSKVTDKIKRVNLALELCTRDPALVEILSGASVITDGTDIIGYSRRGVGAADPAPCSIEIWTKAVGVNNTCTALGASGYGDAKWHRVIWPKATFNLSAVTFENAIATLTLDGFGESNPHFNDGPFNDVPVGITLDTSSPEHMFLDMIGPPTLACGYTAIPVPVQPTGPTA